MFYRCDLNLYLGNNTARGRATRRVDLGFLPIPGLVLDFSAPPHFPVRGSAITSVAYRASTGRFDVVLEPYLDGEETDSIESLIRDLTGDDPGNWEFRAEGAEEPTP